jgi:hypothetical protein
MASSSASRTPPLGKYLASTGTPTHSQDDLFRLTPSADKKTRDKAVKNLAAFLSDPDRPHISSHEMDKLWKGIFYCEFLNNKKKGKKGFDDHLRRFLDVGQSIGSAGPRVRACKYTLEHRQQRRLF